MELKEAESSLEAILFAAGDPVPQDRLCVSMNIDEDTLDKIAGQLADYYRFEKRGIRLIRLEDSYQLCTAPQYADIIRRTLEERKPVKLSAPALEVLAIVAYFQPVTRVYIEQIRGVDSSYTVGLLLDRGLIEECGRLAVPGRPIQYRVTQSFLRTFGLSSLEDLPVITHSVEGEQISLDMDEAVEKLRSVRSKTDEETEESGHVVNQETEPDST